MQVNKKYFEVMNLLKINPKFVNSFSFDKYLNYFNPETLECNRYVIEDINTYKKPTLLSNPFLISIPFHYSYYISLLNKISSIHLFCQDDQNEFFVENAMTFQSFKSVCGEIKMIVRFLRVLETMEKTALLIFHKIMIDCLNNSSIILNETIIGYNKELQSLIVVNNDVIIYLITQEQPSNSQLLKGLKGIE